ncbi:hypothetical protein MMC14_005276 [Varicellaria rhodocarpa]|nr:hypothetical protein [Varicellaria rhodocarpa]
MHLATLLLSRLLALDSITLGRLVLDMDYPEQDFHDSPSLTLPASEVIVKRQALLSDSRYENSGAKAKLSLAYLLGTHAGFNVGKENRLEASEVTTYGLKNSSDKFETLCTDAQTRKWLEKVVGKGRSVYMIVGYETLLQGTLSYKTSKSAAFDAEALVPLSGTPLDPAVGAGVSGNRGRETQVKALDEQVHAVRYRKIDFGWFRSRDLDKASLEKGSRWKIYWGTRDEDYSDEEDDEDVLEASVGLFPTDEDFKNTRVWHEISDPDGMNHSFIISSNIE